MEYRIRHRDGTFRWVWEHGQGVFDANGELVALEGFVADITERRMMEEALREADRRKDDFLAMLGHELRNPLAAISSGITLLQMHPSPDRREWAEQMVERQARQLQRLVDDLLDVTRITRGKIRLHKKALDVRTVLDAAVESVGGLFEDRGHDLLFSPPDQPVLVLADAARLEQVIVNLLTNAAKYTPDGGKVTLAVERSGTEAVIRCADTGIGIAAEMLDAVFESFVQIDPGFDRAASGLGMGLTLVKRLTEMHGGSVSAASAGRGQGSEFTVRLPTQLADHVAGREATGDPAEEMAEEGAMRILVIDDNRDLAESVAMYLRGTGHYVFVAYDGESGIASAEREPPDAILLDLGLPGIDGFEVASRLRVTPALQGAAIIAISGYKPQEERLREAGFDTHLVKPVSYGRLMRTLRETLAARR
jgi:signal transduction histidine kinase/CheY-like chemotaxis protein